MTFKMGTISRVAEDELSDGEKNSKKPTSVNIKGEYGKMEKVETLRCFLMNTTLHGARFVFAEGLLRRCVWNLALFASFVFCCYQAYGSWTQFLQRPFNTRITSKSALEDSLTFPAVTLCNINPQNIHRFVHLQGAHNSTVKNVTNQIVDDLSRLLQLSKDAIDNDILERYPDSFNREKFHVQWILQSHQIEEMLLPDAPPTYTSCLFDGKLCGTSNFTKLSSSPFGQCYTFNSGQNGSQLLRARMAGKNNGLKLRLNIQRDGYVKLPKNPLVGITVLVHDQNAFPFMDEYGLAVEPGSHTSLSIKMRKVCEIIYSWIVFFFFH